MLLKVNEIFETIQGEGFFTGVPSVFIRLQGCPVGCSWCDTKYTWGVDLENEDTFKEIASKREESDKWCRVSVDYLVSYYSANFTAKHIVITGGEPCIYDLTELTKAFEIIGCTCQIETSGTFKVLASENTWVTVSPKVGMKGKLQLDGQALSRANEIKHPVGTEKDLANLEEIIREHALRSEVVVALQPISQKLRATQLCISTCIERNWRLSVQMHKYLEIA